MRSHLGKSETQSSSQSLTLLTAFTSVKRLKMDEKFNTVLDKLSSTLDTWIEEFTTNPVKTTLKVFVIIYLVKLAKKALSSR